MTAIEQDVKDILHRRRWMQHTPQAFYNGDICRPAYRDPPTPQSARSLCTASSRLRQVTRNRTFNSLRGQISHAASAGPSTGYRQSIIKRVARCSFHTRNGAFIKLALHGSNIQRLVSTEPGLARNRVNVRGDFVVSPLPIVSTVG